MIQYNNKYANELNDRLEQLRNEWSESDEIEFEHNEECSCPTCGQDLPEEQLNEAREKAENDFNERKANKLESIVNEANNVKERIENTEKDTEKMKRAIEKYDKEIQSNASEVEKLKKSIEQLESNKTDITENNQYIEKLQEKERIERQISEMRASTQDSINSIHEEIQTLESKKKEIKSDLNKYDI